MDDPFISKSNPGNSESVENQRHRLENHSSNKVNIQAEVDKAISVNKKIKAPEIDPQQEPKWILESTREKTIEILGRRKIRIQCSRKQTKKANFTVEREAEDVNFKEFESTDRHTIGKRIPHPRQPPADVVLSGKMFGNGVYFADLVSNSAKYCGVNQQVGYLMLAEVAVGRMRAVTTKGKYIGSKKLNVCSYQNLA